MSSDRLSSPGLKPIPRETRKSHRRHPPLRSGPRAGASSIVLGLSIAIEAAVVAGSKTARRSDMANIGSFKKVGSDLGYVCKSVSFVHYENCVR
jgi:hypothetical protein